MSGHGSINEANEGNSGNLEVSHSKGKGKGRDWTVDPRADDEIEGIPTTSGANQPLDRLVVFACRHMFHATCLTQIQDSGMEDQDTDSDDDGDQKADLGAPATRKVAIDGAKKGCPLCP